jgi:hypothetical protein
MPVDKWHALIGDPTLGDAILDRLVHNAYRIELKGESMRRRATRHRWGITSRELRLDWLNGLKTGRRTGKPATRRT